MAITEAKPRPIALSVDVEDWFHTESLRRAVPHDTWELRESRVERNTMRILEILERQSARATFFSLGWVAERQPRLVRAIADAGHEVASHGYAHELVYNLDPAKFRDDVVSSKHLLEDLAGCRVRGYRAPCFSITDWAVAILQEAGYTYDSSVVPTIAHDRYGRLNGVSLKEPIFQIRADLYEVCVSCLRFGDRGLPWGGGGYFRLVPYSIWVSGVEAIRRTGQPYVFYMHPWEIDPGQPNIPGVGALNRFRQRVNLSRCENRFEMLAAAYPSVTIGTVLDDWLASRSAATASTSSDDLVQRALS
jgi:polysaccharide deacetylase family protein (PEP-CTERM system associated)